MVKIKNKKEYEKVVWKDKRVFIFIKCLLFIFVIGSLIAVLLNEKDSQSNTIVLLFIFLLLIMMINIIIKSVVSISAKGIILGNLEKNNVRKSLIKFPVNIEWGDVGNMKIITKGHFSGIGGRYFDHLIITLKNKDKYESIIHDPKNFINSLKKINKIDLLDKKSRDKYGGAI